MTHKQPELNTLEYRYVSRWFWSKDELADACGMDAAAVQILIDARCSPGPIYALRSDGTWWSALAAACGQANAEPPISAVAWYSPASAWGLRRALALTRTGVTPATAATMLRSQFVRAFVDTVDRIDHADIAFPGCFGSSGYAADAAAVAAIAEWEDWLNGAYAVCLRVFTAETCIRKETLAARLKAMLSERTGQDSSDDLLEMAEALAGLILPFAPWERAVGTPGVTIDRLLSELNLGRELPYE